MHERAHPAAGGNPAAHPRHDRGDRLPADARGDLAHAWASPPPTPPRSTCAPCERKGAIEILDGTARGIRLTEALGLPLVGRVAAGSPILAEEHIVGRYQVDPSLFRPRADYLLKVRGMSMRDAGILDGDLLAVHKTAEARSGQIVVARLAGRGHGQAPAPPRRDRSSCCPRTRTSSRSWSTCARTPLAIEGIAVGVIRSRAL